MEHVFKRTSIIGTVIAIMIAVGSALVVSIHIQTYAHADDALMICSGNICNKRDAVVFSKKDPCGNGNTASFAYTQNVRPGGIFKIRFFNEQPITSECAISFSVSDMSFPGFRAAQIPGAYGNYARIDNTPTVQQNFFSTTTETVITSVAYQLNKNADQGAPLSGIMDTVGWFTIPSVVAPGNYTFRVSMIEYGQSFISSPLTMMVTSAAPTNTNESEGMASFITLSCGDHVDNDLNFFTDCRDERCDNVIGNDQCIQGNCLCDYGAEGKHPSDGACFDLWSDAGTTKEFDNNANGVTNCADAGCQGKQGSPDSADKKCYVPESAGYAQSCADSFDNDKNGEIDCHDPTCWGKGGAVADAVCPSKELNCNNGINDDFDNGLNNRNSSLAVNFNGGDCKEYDCAGKSFYWEGAPQHPLNAAYKCVSIEGETHKEYDETAPSGSPFADSHNCFDNNDNDLDAYVWSSVVAGSDDLVTQIRGGKYIKNSLGGIDCGDEDCLGVTNPNDTNQKCLDKEFSPPFSGGKANQAPFYQYCANPITTSFTPIDPSPEGKINWTWNPLPQYGIDDNGDSLVNCFDASCNQKFGNCGPCPTYENFTWDACANGRDDDFDGSKDCKDSDCASNIGERNGLARCGAESTPESCSDGFDNDTDGRIDCADSDCTGKILACQTENTFARCFDGIDNNANGTIDSNDSGCSVFYAAGLACKGTLPSWSDPVSFTSGGTVSLLYTQFMHAPDRASFRFVGSGSYTSFTLTIGNANDPNGQFPMKTCSITSGGENVALVEGIGVLQIANKTLAQGQTLSNVNIILTCDLPSQNLVAYQFSIALDALRVVGNGEDVESGELPVKIEVIENTSPTVSAITVSGLANNKVNIPYGSNLAMHVSASDGAPGSGICGCDFWIGATAECTTQDDPLCQKPKSPACSANLVQQTKDIETYVVRSRAEDGAGNLSAYGGALQFAVNVTPIVDAGAPFGLYQKLESVKPLRSPFFAPDASAFILGAKFKTALNGNFSGKKCHVFINGSDSNIELTTSVAGNTASCGGAFTFSSAQFSQDGEYRMTVGITDEDNDEVRIPEIVAYVCSTGNESGVCALADVDQDGAPERIYNSELYGRKRSCDNCVNFYNPSQKDDNANGIGDACESVGTGSGGAGIGTWGSSGGTDDESGIVIKNGEQGGRCVDANVVTELVCRGTNNVACQGNGKYCCFDIGACAKAGTASIELYQPETECCASSATSKDFCPTGYECIRSAWVKAEQGSVYGQKGVGASARTHLEADFCVLSSGDIGPQVTGKGEGCKIPMPKFPLLGLGLDSQTNTQSVDLFVAVGESRKVLSRLDIKGIEAGRKYGKKIELTEFPPSDQTKWPQGGNVYVLTPPVGSSEVLISQDVIFKNGTGSDTGASVILVKGNLHIKANSSYEAVTGNINARNLASVGWIILGNVTIDPEVTSIAGALYVQGTIFTGYSPKQLIFKGPVVANKFQFDRYFTSAGREASEIVLYDGRVMVNPPPGMSDFVKALPVLKEVAP